MFFIYFRILQYRTKKNPFRVLTKDGTYENNNITYQAKLNSAGNQLSFKVIYRDGDPNDPGDGTAGIDEAVSGTFRSIVEQQRATGSYVEVDSPAYANTQTLGE